MRIDTVLHEAAVRGNASSTVRTQMYGIRHHNISKGMPNPLSNKLRYDQLMRALKKFRGPKAVKHPATWAMLIALCKELDWKTDTDDLLECAACLTAFHFMLRSAEYCARLKGAIRHFGQTRNISCFGKILNHLHIPCVNMTYDVIVVETAITEFILC